MSSVTRRELLELGLSMIAASQAAGCATGDAENMPIAQRASALELPGEHIAMLIYPDMTLLDFVGPHTCFTALGMNIHLVWKSSLPIRTESGVTILPTSTFDTCPSNLEIFFVPGSTAGTSAVVRDREALAFVRAYGGRAKLVTSVCTGSLILGAAGLLRGYRATSHWFTRDLLPIVEAVRVDARYVEDRNRITGGGVTSGIDFGLRLVERLRGLETAQLTQLMLEYAPDPPFDAGDPSTAPRAVVDLLSTLLALLKVDGKLALEAASATF